MAGAEYSIEVDLSGLTVLRNAGADLDRLLRSAAFQAGSRVQAEVVQRTPVDLGAARNSIGLGVAHRAGEVTATVSSVLEYMPALEEGRRPGKTPPPFEALIPWVQRHPAPPQSFLTSTGRPSRRRPLSDRSRAFLIARAIGRHGLPAHHMFRDALRVSEPDVVATFQDAVDIFVRRLSR